MQSRNTEGSRYLGSDLLPGNRIRRARSKLAVTKCHELGSVPYQEERSQSRCLRGRRRKPIQGRGGGGERQAARRRGAGERARRRRNGGRRSEPQRWEDGSATSVQDDGQQHHWGLGWDSGLRSQEEEERIVRVRLWCVFFQKKNCDVCSTPVCRLGAVSLPWPDATQQQVQDGITKQGESQ
jgi:hypothetical protein